MATRKTTTSETTTKKRQQAKAVHAADQENARLRDQRKAAKDGQTASERAMTPASKAKNATRANTAAAGAKKRAKATTGGKGAGGGTRAKRASDGAPSETKTRTGILDAAAQILAKAKEPMGCKAIVEQAIAKGLWSTSGKTPQATLYSAMIREIASKGKGARFEKIERGLFQIRRGA